MLNKTYYCCGIIAALLIAQIVMAEKSNDICRKNQSKNKWDFKDLIIKEYRNRGLKIPDWDSEFFEEEYTYGDLWKSIVGKYYDSLARKYDIPRNFLLFKVFKNDDLASLWDTRGEFNSCSLAEEWLKLANLMQPAYPEISNWMRRKINNPNQKIRMPKSSMESDLKNLVFTSRVDGRLYLELSGQDFVHQLIQFANKLKEKFRTIDDE